MLSIDEAIALERQIAKDQIDRICDFEHEQIAKWLEELKAIKSDGFTDNLLNMGFTKGYSKALEELKVIKEMDLSIPQHFTKEQSDWIKKYCINRNKEFYNKALDDFVETCEDNQFAMYGQRYVDMRSIREISEQLKEQDK